MSPVCRIFFFFKLLLEEQCYVFYGFLAFYLNAADCNAGDKIGSFQSELIAEVYLNVMLKRGKYSVNKPLHLNIPKNNEYSPFLSKDFTAGFNFAFLIRS